MTQDSTDDIDLTDFDETEFDIDETDLEIEEDDTEPPDIGGLCRRFRLPLLGGHIEGGPSKPLILCVSCIGRARFGELAHERILGL